MPSSTSSRTEHADRVQVHHGTREAPARLAWLGGPFWQIRLEQQLVPAPDDRLVIRRIAPPDTLGGGRVLDAHPKKHGPSRAVLARLERLARGEEADELGVPRPAHPEAPRPEAVAPQPRRETLEPSALETLRRLKEAGVEPPIDSELDPADLAALREAGSAVRVSRNLHYDAGVLADVRAPVDRDRRAQRRIDHACAATQRARHLAQVRAGAARAL